MNHPDPSAQDYSELLAQLHADGFLQHRDATLTPLAGGVSSNVLLVEDGGNHFIVKQALPRLKVEDVWFADVSRNRHERDYLTCVARLCPDVVPRLLGFGEGYFIMEFLGNEFSTWKHRLLEGDLRAEPAIAIGRALGRIHQKTFADADLQAQFDTTENFHQLRTDPYLLTTGARHPNLREYFEAEANRLESTRECLVHGDYSPKNLLIAPGRLAVLDCEVAWFGDPAFDVAFLLTHLLLKALYRETQCAEFRSLAELAIHHYFLQREMGEQQRHDFDERVGRLLLMLLLARVDGKSPVEYLNQQHKVFIRRFAGTALTAGLYDLTAVLENWFHAIGTNRTGGSPCA